jgi:hypothetical protein
MSNKEFKPNHGDVYRSTGNSMYEGIYRMYIKVPGNDTLLCVKLNDGEAYVHSSGNGLVDPTCEEFVFNMCDLVEKE